jgi:hypothetical protein
MRRILALAMLAALATASAMAEPVDRLFSQPQLGLVGPGASLDYRHLRRDGSGPARQSVREKTIRIERDVRSGQVLVTMDAAGRARRLAPFRGMSGNPALMVFLESVVSAVSEATGGSPLYLRARIREAMRDRIAERAVTTRHAGAEVAAWELTLTPFRDDPHGSKLGDFAGLVLSFVLSEAVPGSFVSLKATASGDPPAYSEEIRLDEPS